MRELKFSENLKLLRCAAGLTQKQLAEKIGVDQRTVSAWEKNVCEPSYSVLLLLSEIFNESLDELLT